MTLPRTRSGRFIPRDAIPGANGCEPPPGPFEFAGVVWLPGDARKIGGAPIGLSLAMEWRAAEAAAKPAEGAA